LYHLRHYHLQYNLLLLLLLLLLWWRRRQLSQCLKVEEVVLLLTVLASLQCRVLVFCQAP
jgi:hypothetical protein